RGFSFSKRMAKKGRPIPAREKRGPRDRKLTIYVTAAEEAILKDVSDNRGFRSVSAMLAYMIEPLCRDQFTGLSFGRLGDQFATLPRKKPASFAWEQLPFIHKKQFPDIDTINKEDAEHD
ncbi:MAG: hypothetical protein AAGF10_03305, partial [Verrucomicrobiota bacterium]